MEVQIVQICNETTIDLCSEDLKQIPSADKASIWPIKSSLEGIEKFEQSLDNRIIFLSRSGVKRIRSHLVISIFVRGRDGQTEAGCLQILDLSGSERVGRTEATGWDKYIPMFVTCRHVLYTSSSLDSYFPYRICTHAENPLSMFRTLYCS